jgi:nickel-dependent lactate racemase
VPQAATVVRATVEALLTAGVQADGIAVLESDDAPDDEPAELLLEGLPDTVARAITLLRHDPDDREELAYLAATEHGDPVLLNRAIHDADLVLPIGCLRRPSAAGFYGLHTTIFPAFSDQQMIERFRSPAAQRGEKSEKKALRSLANEVGWLLGIHFAIEVVPAGGDAALHVVAGKAEAVAEHARALYNAAWSCRLPSRPELVIAGIAGDRRQQTWENLGDALQAAARVVEPGGAIALCCELHTDPGPAAQQLAEEPSTKSALREIRRQRPPDARFAQQLVAAREQAKVYLLSGLDPTLVEDLEMIPLEAEAELARLARLYQSALLLPSAALAMVRVD